MVYVVFYYRVARDWRSTLRGVQLVGDFDSSPYDHAEFETLADALAAPMPEGAGFASLSDGLDANATKYLRTRGEEWGVLPKR